MRAYVKKAVAQKAEIKERIYPFSSVGSGGGNFGSIGYGASAVTGALCAGIVQGTEAGQRVGRTIQLKGVRYFFPSQPGDTNNYMRLILVQPKGTVDLSSVAGFVSQLLSQTGSGATQWGAPIDTDLYTVFFDKSYHLQSMATGEAVNTWAPTSAMISGYIKVNRRIEYQAPSGSTSPLKDLWLVGISDSAAIPHPGAIAGYIKLYYTDV